MKVNGKLGPFNCALQVPGDKSISHRSVIIGSIASGETNISNFLPGEDCLSTVRCLQQLGANIEIINATTLKIHGQGLYGLAEADNYLDVGNSGTSIRLLAGVLAGQDFYSILTGDNSIRRRPMERIINPLRQMGAQIWARRNNTRAPLTIKGSRLKGIHYNSPVASAQVKSAVLLAGLYAQGETSVTEPALSRDHTEKMLTDFGAKIQTAGLTSVVCSGNLVGQNIHIPGDISSAAFFLTAAAIIPESSITVKNVGLNPTRTGIVEALADMGVTVKITNSRENAGELIGDITITAGELKGITIGGNLIPRLIDEIPILSVAAAAAQGETVIKDAAELKVKESNRLQALATELSRFGVNIQETADGLIIKGSRNYRGTVCNSYNDHRIAMACILMGMISAGKTIIQNAECINISFPGFAELLKKLG